MRLIDADALWDRLKEIKEYNKECGGGSFHANMGINQAIGALNEMPVMTAVECPVCATKITFEG